jgi:hypothetical protein
MASLTLAAAGAGCSHTKDDPHQTFGEPQEPAPAYNLTGNDEIKERPGKYMGKEVELNGEVEEIVSDHVFRVDLDGFWGEDSILVVNSTGYNLPLNQDDVVQVYGPVRVFVTTEIEEEVNYDLLDSLYVDYENTPVIVASQVIGFWAEARPTQRYETYADQQPADEKPSEMMVKAKTGQYFEECGLTVYHKTTGAVGNPCMSTEEYVNQILGANQKQAYERWKGKAGRKQAH